MIKFIEMKSIVLIFIGVVCFSFSAKSQFIAGFKFEDNICVGDCIAFTDTTVGEPIEWIWDFGPQVNPITSTEQNPSSVCFNTAGVYNIQLTVKNASDVYSSTNNSITIHESPTVTAQHDTIIDLGGSANLIAISPDEVFYEWTPSLNVDCDTCATTIVQAQTTTEYVVTATSINGCFDTDTVLVKVNFIEGFGVPTAFSPNEDGNNDELFVKGFGIETMTFSVYNRYGEKVFETNDQSIGWDGTFRNKLQPPATYVWVLNYTLFDGRKGIRKGDVTLVR
jgi:gliding motility-associated-like protein